MVSEFGRILTEASIESFVDKLRKIAATALDERGVISQVRPLVREVCRNQDWAKDDYLEVDEKAGFRISTLHEEPNHTLAVFAVSWTPGMGVGPHDHGTWAVVGGVNGKERNASWRRTDDGSRDGYADLEPLSAITAGAGVRFVFQDRRHP